MKKYFKLHCPIVPLTDISTKAKKMIYDSLQKYNNTLLYATMDELSLFLKNIIAEFETHKDSYRKWPVLYSCDNSNKYFIKGDTPSLVCDKVSFIDTEELKQISLDDSNPFQFNINFNEEV